MDLGELHDLSVESRSGGLVGGGSGPGGNNGGSNGGGNGGGGGSGGGSRFFAVPDISHPNRNPT